VAAQAAAFERWWSWAVIALSVFGIALAVVYAGR
jgi:hypothetical protein